MVAEVLLEGHLVTKVLSVDLIQIRRPVRQILQLVVSLQVTESMEWHHITNV